jgi:imidazolonepropionase-like amidohydrolase
VLVQDGTIRAVGRDIAAPPGATIIDGQDRTLLPGLIDSHVHVADDAVSALEQAAVLGVTTVLDMFSAGERLRMLKRVAAMDAEGMADLRTAGTGAAAAGGHPTQMGGPPFPTIADADEAPAFVDARLAEGADFVICESEAQTLLADAFLRPYRAQWRRMLEMSRPARGCDGAKAALEQLMDSRAAVLAGTDAPSPGTTYGASLHGELSLLVRTGLSPSQALASATSVPARAFRLDDRGAIRAGLRADLVLVDGDPTRDILTTRRIVGVWKRGVAVDRKRAFD